MKRIDAIRQIMDGVTDELVVATTGMIAREVFVAKDREANFYMCGSMGCRTVYRHRPGDEYR